MENEVRVHTIEKWQSYLDIINALDIEKVGEASWHLSRGFIFRGHSNKAWKLSSRLERNLEIETLSGGKKR